MALLNRYKKTGGFLQLVQLLETCNPEKQEKLLASIEQESATWAEEVKSKLLDVNRIFSWPDEAILDLIAQIQELTLATSLHGLKEEQKERIFNLMSHSQKRRISDLFDAKQPSAGEITTAFFKTIEEVRDLISKGFIHLKKIDPDLLIPEDVEELIEKKELNDLSTPTGDEFKIEYDEPPTEEGASTPQGPNPDQVRQLASLKNELAKVKQENIQLKNKVKSLTKKVDDVKRALAS